MLTCERCFCPGAQVNGDQNLVFLFFCSRCSHDIPPHNYDNYSTIQPIKFSAMSISEICTQHSTLSSVNVNTEQSTQAYYSPLDVALYTCYFSFNILYFTFIIFVVIQVKVK